MQAYYRMTREMDRTRLFCVVLFLSFCGVLCQQCGNPYKADANVYLENSFLSLEVENKTLAVLTVHSDNLYAAGNNGLFHLSQNLDLESKHVTDGEENVYKILEVSDSLGKLVACSSGGKGGCQLRNVSDVSVNSSSANAYFHENIVASGEYRTVGKIAQGKSGSDSLYVARSINLNGADRVNRAVFERDLMSNGNDDRQTNVITSSAQDSFVIYYSDVFSYGGFVYYLASQRDDATTDSPIVSKLSRVCQNDASSDFKAFAELQLSCKGEDGSLYNITQSAQQIDNDLYIVFNKNGDERHEYNPQPQSALCVYNMTEIEEKFAANSQACACYRSSNDDNSNINYLSRASCGVLFEQFGEDFAGCDSLGIENLRSKFTCAGELGSTRFFAYPEGPGDQEVPAKTLYEANFTFTSLSVTSVPRDDSQRIAFIGTKEGKLLKVNLNGGSCSNYEVVNIGFRILGDTTMYNNESLLVLTDEKVLKMKVTECSQFTSCQECIRPGTPLGDPYCGWCTLKKQCTRYNDCQHPNETSRWLPYNEDKCVAIDEVTPKSLAREFHSQKIQIRVNHLPELIGEESYECYFNDWNVSSTVSGNFLNCTSPPMTVIPEPDFEDHVTMTLHIFSSETGKKFITRDYEFYDCSRIKSCLQCVDSKRKSCHWCLYEHKCTLHSDACRKSISGSYESSNTSTESCPQILPGRVQYVPSGGQSIFEFWAKNLLPLRNSGVKEYDCCLTKNDYSCDRLDFMSPATLQSLDNVTFKVTCDSNEYSYKERKQFLEANLFLKWNEDNTVDNYQEVKLYKCEVDRPDCSRCLSHVTTPDILNCTWCKNSNICAEESMCVGPKTSGRNAECPGPEIHKVSPSSSTLGGGTVVTVTGSDLGKAFEEIENLSLAGVNCNPMSGSYEVGKSIKCKAGPNHQITEDGDVTVQILENSVTKSNSFSYKDPQVDEFTPERGPMSGGTSINITGDHLNTGGDVKISIGNVSCTLESPPTATTIICRTMEANATFQSRINVTFDGTESKFSRQSFIVGRDPTVASIWPLTSIQSGGNHLTVTGTDFDLIQMPQIVASFAGNEISSATCHVKSETEMTCFSPKLNRLYPDNLSIGFKLDGVTSLRMWTTNQGKQFQYLEDPQYFPFDKNKMAIKPHFPKKLVIEGKKINVASKEEDVKVFVGKEKCNITLFNESRLECTLPIQQPEAGDIHGNRSKNGLPFVIVMHGFLEVPLGYLYYERDTTIYILVVGIVLLVLFLVFSLLITFKVKQRKSHEIGILLEELEVVRSTVRNELKVFNDTLQMAVDNFEINERNRPQMKMIDRREYVQNFLFLNLIITPEDELTMNTKLSSADEAYFELFQNESFFLHLIRIMEDNTELSVKERVNFSALITVYFLLKGQLSFLLRATKIPMAERIMTTVGTSLSEGAFKGRRSILNNIVSNIVKISLYDFLLSEIAENILQLHRAIKYVIEKGPIDAVTGKTQLSLSPSHLLTSQIEYEEITLKVLFKYESIEITEISFLSVDSISQVKNKILDHFFKGRRDQMLLNSGDFDLVLHHRTDEKTVLRDDGILNRTNNWRRINVIADYKVQKGDCVELVKLQDSDYETVGNTLITDDIYYTDAYDGSLDDDDDGSYEDCSFLNEDQDNLRSQDEDYLTPKENRYGDNSFIGGNALHGDRRGDPKKQLDGLDGMDPSNYNGAGVKHVPRVWHLIKDESEAVDKLSNQKKDYHTKAVQDLTRSYLPVTGNMIQKYFKNVLDVLMTSSPSQIPIVVKDIFDFFDRNAEKQRTPALAKKWKSNVLMINVYSCILSKPSLIYNIKECSYVKVSLDILSQTLREICTDGKQIQREFLQNVELFSHLVPVYTAKLDRYFAVIKGAKKPNARMINAECERIEKAFAGTFDLLTVKRHLCETLQRYKDQIYEVSRKDHELGKKLKWIQSLS